MNVELAITVDNGVMKVKVTSPEMPVVIETPANDPGTTVTATAEQKENVSPVTETVTAEDKVKADISVLSEKLDSMTRQYERVKKAAWRAGKRLEKYLKASGQTVPATGNLCPQTATAGSPQSAVNRCPSCVPSVQEACPQIVPGDSWGQGQLVTTYSNNYNTNSITNSISTKSDNVIDHVTTSQTRKETKTLSPFTGIAAPAEAEIDGNCLPFVPEGTHGFIPFANLPEMYQNILNAWNNLPLPEKLKGLYPDVAQKLHKLLKEYGEAAVQKAIHMVTESPFLLGKISNTRGWRHIYFGWLLNPANLKKILENKYRNREQRYDCVTYPEYIPWENVEAAVSDTTITAEAYKENNTATPASGSKQETYTDHNTDQSFYLDPEYMLKGMDPLTDQARCSLAHAAKLLGLTKIQAA